MLVLTRKLDERIMIGDDIVIMVVDIKDGRVRLGIEAPSNVCVDREEVRALRDKGDTHEHKTA